MEEDQDIELKASLWNCVKDIVTEEVQSLGKTATNEYIVSLAEVIQSYMATMALDLEAFSNHAKRVVISMDDVKLCARRNEGLQETLKSMADDIQD